MSEIIGTALSVASFIVQWHSDTVEAKKAVQHLQTITGTISELIKQIEQREGLHSKCEGVLIPLCNELQRAKELLETAPKKEYEGRLEKMAGFMKNAYKKLSQFVFPANTLEDIAEVQEKMHSYVPLLNATLTITVNEPEPYFSHPHAKSYWKLHFGNKSFVPYHEFEPIVIKFLNSVGVSFSDIMKSALNKRLDQYNRGGVCTSSFDYFCGEQTFEVRIVQFVRGEDMETDGGQPASPVAEPAYRERGSVSITLTLSPEPAKPSPPVDEADINKPRAPRRRVNRGPEEKIPYPAVLWVDDNISGNQFLIEEAHEMGINVYLMTCTSEAKLWLREHPSVLKASDKEFRVITDNARSENGGLNLNAGEQMVRMIRGMRSIHTPILVYCNDLTKTTYVNDKGSAPCSATNKTNDVLEFMEDMFD